MAEYIEKKRAVDELTRIALQVADSKTRTVAKCISAVELLPTAEVEPVQQGQWEGSADGYANGVLVYDMWRCSECGFDADGAEEKPEWKFCPNCGARMDKENEQ